MPRPCKLCKEEEKNPQIREKLREWVEMGRGVRQIAYDLHYFFRIDVSHMAVYRHLQHSGLRPEPETPLFGPSERLEGRREALDAVRKILVDFFAREVPQLIAEGLARRLVFTASLALNRADLERELAEGIISPEEYERELRRIEKLKSVFARELLEEQSG